MSNKSRRNGNQRPAASASGPRGYSSKRSPEPAQGSNARRTLERYSAPALVTLHNLPRWLIPVALAVTLFLGLLLSGPWAWLGAVLLVIVGLFVSWLTALSWPILSGSSRLVRVLVGLALFGLAFLKATGRWG